MSIDALSEIALNLSPSMLSELAFGLEPPVVIAARYGLNADQFFVIASKDWFQAKVLERRTLLDDGGYMFKEKAKLMVEEMSGDIYRSSKAGLLSPVDQINAVKLLAELADMKPKPQAQANLFGQNNAPQFSINITLPAPAASEGKEAYRPPHLRDVTPVGPMVSINLDKHTSVLPADTTAMGAPEPVTVLTNLPMPDFDLTGDIAGMVQGAKS